MQTRDVVSTSATILGLIVTAFGVIVALGDESNQIVIKNFSLMFISVVILFSCAVSLTTISSLLNKEKLWNCALIVYVFGWAFFGSVIIVTLLGYAYGIEMFQIQLPEFNFQFVTIIATIFGSIVTAIITFFLSEQVSKYVKMLKERSSKMKVDQEDLEFTGLMLQREAFSITDELVILRADIEREIRKLAEFSGVLQKFNRRYIPVTRLIYALLEEQVITPQIANDVRFVYHKCSKAVHGESLPKRESELILEIGLKTLLILKKIVKKIKS